MTKTEAIIQQFENALNRLKEAIKLEKNDIVRDSAIKRFEFTLDLSWKMLKAFLEEKLGITVRSPKECFREAYRQGLIEYDADWLTLVDLRNETAHIYNEEIAEKIYQYLPKAANLFDSLLDIISKKLT
jgi:nucleotidyltransferase substrate binding protein (TIGR01987 family)